MKLEKNHAIIDTAEEAACFASNDRDYLSEWVDVGLCYTPTRADVLETITAKEGDAVFWYGDEHDGNEEPYYEIGFSGDDENQETVKANALTIGKTVGKLRALLAWAKGEA